MTTPPACDVMQITHTAGGICETDYLVSGPFTPLGDVGRPDASDADNRRGTMHPNQVANTRKYRQTPKGQYAVHKANAVRRKIEFLLTFDQWWKIWQKSGKWSRRGNRAGCYVMGRHEDTGPYAEGNVAIIPFSKNTAVRNRVVAVRRHTARSTTVTFPEL